MKQFTHTLLIMLIAVGISSGILNQQVLPLTESLTLNAEAITYTKSSSNTSCIVKRGSDYYYVEPKTGVVRTTPGFVKHAGHTYYVQPGGRLAVGKTMTIDGGKYHFGGTGAALRGLHKWGEYYYLSNAGTGKIVTTQRFVEWRGNKFYVYSGGRLAKGTFKVGNKYYKAWSNGKIVKGVYKWPNDKYYYSDPGTGEWITEEGFVRYEGRAFFVNDKGELYFNRPFVYKNRPYSADSRGVCRLLSIPKTSNGVLSVAQKQVGTMTGRKYWVWYYKTRFRDTDATPWCGAFVAWCYNESGNFRKISRAERYGPLGYVPTYTRFANNYGKWVNKKNAKGGDIIVFGRDRHVGIVECINGNYIFTIEGNSGPTAAYRSGKPGAVTRKVYALDDKDIKGIIHP